MIEAIVDPLPKAHRLWLGLSVSAVLLGIAGWGVWTLWFVDSSVTAPSVIVLETVESVSSIESPTHRVMPVSKASQQRIMASLPIHQTPSSESMLDDKTDFTSTLSDSELTELPQMRVDKRDGAITASKVVENKPQHFTLSLTDSNDVSSIRLDASQNQNQKSKSDLVGTPERLMDPPVDLSITETIPTSTEMAENTHQQALIALDSGDSEKAFTLLTLALTLSPKSEVIRQHLAAVAYGRGDVSFAIDTLQSGLNATQFGQPILRLTLAKLWQQERQSNLALSALLPEFNGMSEGYLVMRGALAQEQKNNRVAIDSYQRLLAQFTPKSAWWMGLGIAFERDQQKSQAITAYQQAVSLSGLSSSSQRFIQQRLAMLTS